MHLHDLLTNDAILQELGKRLERHRIARNLTQDQLADQAGIGRATLQRLESGDSVQLSSLVKLLRALALLGALDAAIPEPAERPIAQLERQQRSARTRASGRRGGHADETEARPWRWGDEPEAGT